jgi:sterol desaturase/sphingolipid hydroxylase (fatty acid hydroxylase superfamily)
VRAAGDAGVPTALLRTALTYEHRAQRPISRHQFLRRLAEHGGYAMVLIAISLAVGMVGFHVLARLSWIDAFLNAAMLIGGMGPVDTLPTDGAKLFAGLFALYAGLLVLVMAALLLTPVFHRLLHHFHWTEREGRSDRD